MLTSESIGESIVSGLKEFADKVVDSQKDLQQEQARSVLAADRHFGSYKPPQLPATVGEQPLLLLLTELALFFSVKLWF